MSHAGKPPVFTDEQIKTMIGRLHDKGVNPSYPAFRAANPECYPHTTRFRKLRDEYYAESGKERLLRNHSCRSAEKFYADLQALEGVEDIEERKRIVREMSAREMRHAYGSKAPKPRVSRGRVNHR